MAKTETRIAPEVTYNYVGYHDYHGQNGEAVDIGNLYRKIYGVGQDTLRQTRYPYPEAFDPEWIHEYGTNGKCIWWVVTNSHKGDSVIGSVTIPLDFEHGRGLVRGLLIDPDYQGLGLGGYIYNKLWLLLEQRTKGKIQIFWCENRTAHPKSQKIAEGIGFRPVGILPNKDVFLDKRESDLLMARYARNTLKSRRTEPTLIPELLHGTRGIYPVIQKQFRLEDAIRSDIPRVRANGYDVRGQIANDKYDYLYCTFRTNGSQLKCLVNPRIHCAEKLWFTPEIEPTELATLLRFARTTLSPALNYMECYGSAYEPAIQRVFADAGFTATGYIPGWDVVGQAREDRIIFSWVRDLPPLSAMQLTQRASNIAEIFLS